MWQWVTHGTPLSVIKIKNNRCELCVTHNNHEGFHVEPQSQWNPYTMSTPNWKIIKNEYETLGTGIKELASSHHVSEKLVLIAIKEGKWTQEKDVENMNADDLSARLAIMDTRHQAELVPRFIALQEKMLTKCDTLLNEVRGLEDATNLKIVSEVIEKHRPAIMGTKDGDKADNNITVRILSKVGDGADVAVNAVEITTSAGETNGLGVPCGTPTH